VLEPELMDDPALDPSDHDRALRGLARINRLSFAGRAHLPALALAAGRSGGGGRAAAGVRVLDVGAGSGDGAVSLALAAKRRGVAVKLVLADISPRAVEAGRNRAAQAGLDAEGVVVDAVGGAGTLPAADLAVCSLFLHHLTEVQALAVLGNMRESVSEVGGVVSVNDLRRGAWGSVLANTVPRMVTRSPVVHTDAAISARAAWTASELLDLAARAGMSGARVHPCFPARMTLVWSAA